MTDFDDGEFARDPDEFELRRAPLVRGTLILEFSMGKEEYGITVYPWLFPEVTWNYCDATEYVRDLFAESDEVERGMGLAQLLDLSPLSPERPVALVSSFCSPGALRILDPKEPHVKEIETRLAGLLHNYLVEKGLLN